MLKKIRKFYIRVISETMWLLEKVFFYKKLSKVIIKSRILSNSSIVFDVGANRGQSIAFFKKMFPLVTVLAFEPSPRVFLKLQKKWENKKNISLFELALGAAKGETVFFEHLLDETSTMSPPNPNSTWQKRKNRILLVRDSNSFEETLVQVTTLDIFCAENGIRQIDLLKIDVEGFEYNVLKGAQNVLMKGAIKAIQIKRHMDDMRIDNSSQINEFLNYFNFNLWASIKHTVGNYYEDIYIRHED